MTAHSTARLTILLLIPALVASPRLARAAHPNVRVSGPGANQPEEVTITVDPANPLRLAGGANIRYAHRSFDGGSSWIESVVTSPLGTAGDPVMLHGGLGDLYDAHLSHIPGGPFYDRMVVQPSTDGGVTWSDGTGIGLNPPKLQDKPGLAVDLTGSPHANNVYLAWTEFDVYGSFALADSTRILFSRSSDLGQTWSAPVRLGLRRVRDPPRQRLADRAVRHQLVTLSRERVRRVVRPARWGRGHGRLPGTLDRWRADVGISRARQ